MDIEQLNRHYGFQDGDHMVRFSAGKGDIPQVEIRNGLASAVISLQGAHVLSWLPVAEEEVIWLSTEASFAPGQSVRGGIPVCWPWFGAHADNPSFPAHGFARTAMWQVAEVKSLASGETQISFCLDTRHLPADTQVMWPQPTLAEYSVTIGRCLSLELSSHNLSKQAFTLGQALHTYFAVADVAATKVFGLEGKDYLDKTDDFRRKTQTGAITIDSEVDRIYLQTTDDVVIDDGRRKITIRKQGSRSTVVWNPWETVAARMGDLGEDGYRKMLCVESANAAEDTLSIGPNERHTLRVVYSIER
jgi:glucose-6-phosphate 1-epimerase